jgi:hypothetical protein
MDQVAALVNKAMEAVGCGVRAYVEEDTLLIRDVAAIEHADGLTGVYDIMDMENPLFSIPSGTPDAVAGAVSIQVLRKIVSSALGS